MDIPAHRDWKRFDKKYLEGERQYREGLKWLRWLAYKAAAVAVLLLTCGALASAPFSYVAGTLFSIIVVPPLVIGAMACALIFAVKVTPPILYGIVALGKVGNRSLTRLFNWK